MAESHMAYMHGSFPASRGHDHHSNLSHEHTMGHHDGMLRQRVESHSVPHTPTGGPFISGHGHASMGHAMSNSGSKGGARMTVGKGTV